MSEVTIAGMPCVSSRPRTTSASIWRRRAEDDDQVGHAAVHSQTATRAAATPAIDLHQDHRHVVVLVGAADERLDLAQDPLAQLAGLEMAVLLDDVAQTRSSPNRSLSAFIASVMPSV